MDKKYNMKTIVCCSASKGFIGWAIRGLTTLSLRRTVLKKYGFSRFKAIISVVASLFGKGMVADIKAHVNHAFLLYKSEDFGQWFAVEIDPEGVEPKPARKALRRRTKLIEYFATTLDVREGMRRSFHRVGRKYDFFGVVGFFLAIIKTLFTGKKPMNIFHSDDRDFCSEYVSSVLMNTPGFYEPLNPASTAPIDLSVLMSSHEEFRSVNVSELRKLGLET